VIDWIKKSVEASAVESVEFVRALFTSVCNRCIRAEEASEDKFCVDEDMLKQRTPLLKKFVTPALEIQALYALQALLYRLQHPSGVLLRFFNVLYDEDVIAEDSFKKWRDSTDAAASPGRGVALTSVKDFFQWLSSTDNADS
jgi:hypothetical protein